MSDPDRKVASQSSAEQFSSRPPGFPETPLLPAFLPAAKTPSSNAVVPLKHLVAQRKKKTCSSGPSPGPKSTGLTKSHIDPASFVSNVPRATVGKRRPQRRRKLPRDREEDEDCEMEVCEDTTVEVRRRQGDDDAAGLAAGEYVFGAAPAHETASATPTGTKGPDALCFLCLAPVYLAGPEGQTDAAAPRGGGGGPDPWLSSYFEEPITAPQQQQGMFSGHQPMMGLVPSYTAWEAGGTALSQVRGPAPTPAWTVAGRGSASAQPISWAIDASGPQPPAADGDAYHAGFFQPARPGAPTPHAAPTQWAPGSRPLPGPLMGGLFDLAATGGGGEPWVLLGSLSSTFSEGPGLHRGD